MFKRVLIATDFSRHAHYAMQRAMQFAEFFQAELTCLHVMNPSWHSPIPIFEDKEKEQALFNKYKKKSKTLYDKELKKLTATYPMKFSVLEGRTPNQIIKYIEDHAIDMVFMGTHGTYYLNDLILGTNSGSVVKQTQIPVQLIKKDPDFAYQRILVTTDFSDTSKKALEFAYQAYPNAKFQLLHVADVWYEKMPDESDFSFQLHEDMHEELENKLVHFLKGCAVDPKRFSLKFIGGYPAHDIAKYATLWDAHLVVMGVKSHSLLHYILLGRVTDSVLRMNPTDMLIVPPSIDVQG